MQTPRRKLLFGPPPDPTLPVAKLLGSYTKKGSSFSIYAVVLTISLFGLITYVGDIGTMARLSPWQKKTLEIPDAGLTQPRSEIAGANLTAEAVGGVPETCDLARGEWVFDDVEYPLYREEDCQDLSRQMSCLQNGRREAAYQKWRWQPAGCSLPKFDAKQLLERLRGKRMLFVGDSINRNQWESLVCLIQAAVPPEGRSRRVAGSRIIFTAKDYDASIEFYWAPFLVESNSDDPNFHSIAARIIDADAIEKHAVHWKGADVLVFNTYIWWMNTLEMRVLRPGAKNWTDHDPILRYEAYERVLGTLTNWLDRNVDPVKASVFFMSMSPIHFESSFWGNAAGIKCAKETQPIADMAGVVPGTDMKMFEVAKRVLGSPGRRVPVGFVDVTAMSERRKDAHASVFTVRQGGRLLTPEQQARPAEFADCIHWCLPGLPDAWNQVLSAHLLSAIRRR
ncbi:xylan O-acetyltransferase 1-like [Curcuma longa]|uniref:xylan O-acetyltransferase 1-like n=1 Tax=Curcuma longa TaxID=136217 RepID=UPI003D9F0679